MVNVDYNSPLNWEVEVIAVFVDVVFHVGIGVVSVFAVFHLFYFATTRILGGLVHFDSFFAQNSWHDNSWKVFARKTDLGKA